MRDGAIHAISAMTKQKPGGKAVRFALPTTDSKQPPISLPVPAAIMMGMPAWRKAAISSGAAVRPAATAGPHGDGPEPRISAAPPRTPADAAGKAEIRRKRLSR